MNEEREDVVRKVRKLFALSQSPNLNEAAAAAAKARRLLLEHGLEMEEIGEEEEIAEDHFLQTTSRNSLLGQLLSIIANFNMCAVLVYAVVGKMSGAKLGHRWAFVGRKSNTATAKEQARYLVEIYDRHARAAANAAGNPGKAWLNDYRLGWIEAIQRKFNEAKIQDTTQERALVVQQDGAVQAYLDKNDVEHVTPDIRAPENADAIISGFRDGSTVSVNRQLREEP